MIGSILSGVVGGANAISSAVTSGLNYQLQKKQFEYQKNLQQQIFQREDSSVQRRVSDLKKSGMNPMLAMGQSASSGNLVPTQAPQFGGADMSQLSTLGNLYLEGMRTKEDVARSRAQREIMKAETKQIQAQTKNITSDTFSKDMKNQITNETGITSGGVLGDSVRSIYGVIKAAVNGAKNRR